MSTTREDKARRLVDLLEVVAGVHLVEAAHMAAALIEGREPELPPLLSAALGAHLGITFLEADALRAALAEGRMEDAVATLCELSARLGVEVVPRATRRLSQDGVDKWASQPGRGRRECRPGFGRAASVAVPRRQGGRGR